jgi:hypothetical protein
MNKGAAMGRDGGNFTIEQVVRGQIICPVFYFSLVSGFCVLTINFVVILKNNSIAG